MAGYRADRISELIHREVTSRLLTDIKDPRMVPLSITSVEVNRDLSRAIIFYMPLGGGDPSDELKEAISEACKRMRGPIGRALSLRHAPQLVFQLDTHTDRAFRVNALMQEAARQRGEELTPNASVPKPASDDETEGDA